MELQWQIEQAWNDRSLLSEESTITAIEKVVEALNSGILRVANPDEGQWLVNAWIKKAILLYFSIKKMSDIHAGDLTFYDKIPLKKDFQNQNVRVVPHGIARYGSYLAPGVVMMPSYVNIGAYVDSGTMIDTWATVGSCAQIGKNVHLSGGVGIGGVLEPLQANPVIIEDNCFIGSRAIVVEGVRIGKEAVLGAGVVITASTRIIDVSQEKAIEYKGFIPDRSVVIPGNISKSFPAGTYYTPCALIIGQRKISTDKKVSLNDALRDFNVAV
ncbi:MAG: 2,3,4,5-tetrahydropyridine-2,6-dicarboxylate N-succinyltransferase [Bacteroidales bacterium]|jgi:2,3,4,5-tetrahydropyridine-2-carboxylate N-succinyltransferase|nr:2,3,4,5-tetrahydropyridine-2,6-dicarboxylate N-succinyltransferase [Bacteroidales bacterium]